ncbi:MAG: glycerate kinase type-2 family protein, partial [Nitrospirota bacterium]
MDRETKELLTQIYRAAVSAADSYSCVKKNLTLDTGDVLKASSLSETNLPEAGRSEAVRAAALVINGVRYPLAEINYIYIIAAGKAAYGMSKAAEDILGGLVREGVAVTKDGYGGKNLTRVKLFEASHPLPDGRGIIAAGRIMDMAKSASAGDLVLCLLSGGASSLMILPAVGISLKDKQEVTRLLLLSGADIGEINCVRKHLSAVKGGRLAEAIFPARAVSIIISDVVGDDTGVIASGPTASDETTYLQALEILKIRGVYERVPPPVREHLQRGASGLIPETPKPGDDVFKGAMSFVAASNSAALTKASETAAYLGYRPYILDGSLTGEARDAAKKLAQETFQHKRARRPTPACLLAGGETTVSVRGDGLGGRNQEMALAFALEIKGDRRVSALFAGTDGNDGLTEAAGAFADGD